MSGINDALYEQLVATSAALEQPIRGVDHHARGLISDELREAEQAQLAALQEQLTAIDRVIAALDVAGVELAALEATGWPGQPVMVLNETLYMELQGENADLDAGAATFVMAELPVDHFRVTEELVLATPEGKE